MAADEDRPVISFQEADVILRANRFGGSPFLRRPRVLQRMDSEQLTDSEKETA